MRLTFWVLAGLIPAAPAAATTFGVVASLNAATTGYLATPAIAAGGSVFVSTYVTGSNDFIFSIPATGGTATKIAAPTSTNNADREAIGQLIADTAGNLYGTTPGGGSTGGNCKVYSLSGCGTAFKLVKSGSSYSVQTIYSFAGGTGPQAPAGGLIADSAGNLYGVSYFGGAATNCPGGSSGVGCGTVFKLTPPVSGTTWALATLYTFQGGSDGYMPNPRLTFNSAGQLFGTTRAGGNVAVSSCQTPFSGLNTSGAQTGCGTVFKLTPPASGTSWSKSTLYTFQGTADGANPQSGVVLDSTGALYGAATQGGDTTLLCRGGTGASGCGTIFKLVPAAFGKTPWKQTVLYSFPHTGSAEVPLGVLRDRLGNLFGAAEYSPSNCSLSTNLCGEVFKLTKPALTGGAWGYIKLHSFAGGTDGAIPGAPLTVDSNGVLYGITLYGSTNVVYSVSATGFTP